MVCLAHLSCFASAANAAADENLGSPRNRFPPRTRTALPPRWIPSRERTDELLRVLELGISSQDGVSQQGLDGRWRAFDEEGGGGVEALVLLACTARARGDAGGAVSLFRRALALDPHCLEGGGCCFPQDVVLVQQSCGGRCLRVGYDFVGFGWKCEKCGSGRHKALSGSCSPSRAC